MTKRPEPSLDDVLERLALPVVITDDSGHIIRINSRAVLLVGRPHHEITEAPIAEWLVLSGSPLPPRTRRTRTATGDILHTGRGECPVNVVVTPLAETGWMFTFPQTGDSTTIPQGAIESVAGNVAQRLEALGTTISAAVSMALMDSPEEPLAETLREVLAATQELAVLERELRSIGRRSVANVELVSLSQVVKDAEGLLRRVLEPGIHLAVESDAAPDFIQADCDLLQQVLLRLARFYAQHLPDGSRCYLRIRGSRDGAAPVRMVIVDDGPGLSPGEPNPFLERFRPPGDGEGFDAAIIHGIVEQHRGRLFVDSEVGGGMRVHMEFPAAEHPVSAASSHEPPTLIPRGSETVFVVEDDPQVLPVLVQTLSLQGYKVVEASNGVEASVVLRERIADFDMLLIDAVLPGRSGLELIAEAREFRPHVPVLLISAYTRESLGGRIQEDIPLLPKPFGPVTLARRVRELLDEEGE